MKLYYLIFLPLLFMVTGLKAQTDTGEFVYEKRTFKLEEEQIVNKNGFLRYSLITGFREGVKPIRGKMKMRFEVYDDPVAGTRRMAMYNLSIPELLNFFEINPERLVLEVKGPSKYLYKPEYGDYTVWMRKHTFCYELELPLDAFSEGTMNDIKSDVSASFGVTLKAEKRMSTDNQRYGLAAGQPNREVEVLVLTESK